jgi:molybdopterin molybdotransferase
VAILITGDELLDSGLPRPGHVRDALGPMLPTWIADLGGRSHPPLRVPDDAARLRDEVEDADADLIVTTGSTAAGASDHLRQVLISLDARWLVDGVAVRPGHPMMLARLSDGRFVLGLPGNPLAAISGLLTLGMPLLDAMQGRSEDAEPMRVFLGGDVRPHPHDTRLIPVTLERQPRPTAMPLRFTGPAMLRGLAHADALAVVTPDSGRRGDVIEVLSLASR